MPHGETAAQLTASLDRAREEGFHRICLDAEKKAGLPRGILLAVSSRETHCRNIVGDGGHGRGAFQIDDRSHTAFLAKHGVQAGGVPPLGPAAAYAAQLLLDNGRFGRQQGVKASDLLKFSLSAYNAGAGNAIKGYKAGDSDARTANGNYGKDVLERLRIVLAWLDGGPLPQARPVLREGARGKAVLELKELLAAAAPEGVLFAMTPVWGHPLTVAVKEFQRRHGLDDDGVVGENTWRALEAIAPAKAPA
jgi:peptidoglycan hydrolase-like protein with peptidoglycan-binding domain